jgi:hypothetical protein
VVTVPALFDSLHEVAQVLSEHVREEVGIADVQAGSPQDIAATTAAAARITLLYVTPQQGHRNDPSERQPDGTRRPPPLSLSCFYLVTTSGTADGEEPVAAHHALGRIMTLYHDHPVLSLPLTANPGVDPDAFTDLGEGELNVTQIPMTLEQIDKIWSSLDTDLQPWALFEVAPVQLLSLRTPSGPAPVVRPGGIALDVRAGTRPAVERVTPEVVRQGGRIRIDTVLSGELESMSIGGVPVPAGDSSLVVGSPGSTYYLTLDDDGLEALGADLHRLSLRAGGLVSRRSTMRVAEAVEAVVDAPLPHDPDGDLVLTGANLDGATEALLWPDGAVASPPHVHTLSLTEVAAGTVTVASASSLSGHGPWRLTLRVGERLTPYVLVERAS